MTSYLFIQDHQPVFDGTRWVASFSIGFLWLAGRPLVKTGVNGTSKGELAPHNL